MFRLSHLKFPTKLLLCSTDSGTFFNKEMSKNVSQYLQHSAVTL